MKKKKKRSPYTYHTNSQSPGGAAGEKDDNFIALIRTAIKILTAPAPARKLLADDDGVFCFATTRPPYNSRLKTDKACPANEIPSRPKLRGSHAHTVLNLRFYNESSKGQNNSYGLQFLRVTPRRLAVRRTGRVLRCEIRGRTKIYVGFVIPGRENRFPLARN